MSERTVSVELIPVGNDPEDVVVWDDGRVIAGTVDGRILAISPGADSSKSVVTYDERTTIIKEITNTGGRPLGLDKLADGRLLVCDSRKGLLAISMEDGAIETLIRRGEHDLSFCNNPAIAADGRIFFSDSSQRYPFEKAREDVIEKIPTGRLLCRHPDGRVEVLLEKLAFANGVVLAPDESFVLVAETGGKRISRYWLSGATAGKHDYFDPDTPCLPDNLSVGSDGLAWCAFVTPATKELLQTWGLPTLLRRLVSRIPVSIMPAIKHICRVRAYSFDGAVVHDLVGDAALFEQVTGVREHNGTVYLGSLFEFGNRPNHPPITALLQISTSFPIRRKGGVIAMCDKTPKTKKQRNLLALSTDQSRILILSKPG